MNRLKTALAIALSAGFVFGVGGLSCGKSEEPEKLPELFQPRTNVEAVFGHPVNNCAECHPQHVAEWSISPHAYATRDPVFHAMTVKGQKDTRGRMGQFCIQCHSPIALALGTAPVVEEDGIFKQKTTELPELESQGVSCDVCHSITEVIEPVNARAVLTPNGVRRATIKDPVDTNAHRSEYSPLHEESLLCGMCHAVINGAGAPIEETFPEWQRSSFAQPGGQTCQDCHMPEYDGPAATDGPQRKVHRHLFVGVDVSLLPEDEFPGYHEMRDLTAELLRSSARVTTAVDPAAKRVNISIQNLAGHALPSGATAEREMWVELIVRTSSGAVVFETGTLDENGDLRDDNPDHTTRPGTDPQLIHYGQQMLSDPKVADPYSTGAVRKVTFPWEANAVANRLIEPDATDQRSVDLSALPPGTYQASFRLLFRTFPMYFLRKLEVEGGLDPAVKGRVPIVEMHAETLEFSF